MVISEILLTEHRNIGLLIETEEVRGAAIFMLYHVWGGHKTLLRIYRGLAVLRDAIRDDADNYLTLYDRGYDDGRQAGREEPHHP